MSQTVIGRVDLILELYDEDLTRASTYLGLKKATAHDRFQTAVRRVFKMGVHSVYAKVVLDFLKRTFGDQAEQAEALELADRTSISQMVRSGRISGAHLTYLLHLFRDEMFLLLPSHDEGNLGGYVKAVTYVRQKRLRDKACDEALTVEECKCLFEGYTSKTWRDAQCRGDQAAVQAIGESILGKAHLRTPKPWRVRTVPMLAQTLAEWRDAFLLTVWAMTGERPKA
jgi:hypothetical protein